jgi:putative heme degradation protein
MNKMVRKQFFITAEQNKRLRAHAAAAGVSEAELVRAGIDLRLERKPEKTDWRRLAESFSPSWAERENLDEEMREIRRRWNRRDQTVGRKAKRL